MEAQITSVQSVRNQPLPVTIALPEFDLTAAREKLLRESRQLWKTPLTETDVRECERQYKKYLARCKQYPNAHCSPSKQADWMWHTHILYMKRYEQDCLGYLGRVLYHRPFDRKSTCDASDCATACGCTDTCYACESVAASDRKETVIKAKGDCESDCGECAACCDDD